MSKPRALLVLVLVVLALVGFFVMRRPGEGRAVGHTRPNVLFIAIDDLRPELGCYGAPEALTPHLDRLSAEGVRFDRAYVTYPVCQASRAAMLTGLRLDYTSLGNRGKFPELIEGKSTWPRTLHDAGYWTVSLGKICHGSIPEEYEDAWDVPGEDWHDGVKDWSPELMEKVVAQGGHADPLQRYIETGKGGAGALIWQSIDGDDDVLNDGKTATKAIELLRSRPRERPFLICAGFKRPHLPWLAPARYFDLYPEDACELAEVPPGFARELLAEDQECSDQAEWNEGVSDEEARLLIRAYLASTSYVDAQVGRLLAALAEEGLEESTIVVVWGDHGYHLTDHGMWRKNSIYHVANRIPLIVKAPGVSRAGTCSRIVESLDLYPTLMDLTGVAMPDLDLPGKSLRPLLEDPSLEDSDIEWDHPAFISAGRYYGIVTDRYRFAISPKHSTKLFDLHDDPDEWNNLAADPGREDLVNELRARVAEGWGLDELVLQFLARETDTR